MIHHTEVHRSWYCREHRLNYIQQLPSDEQTMDNTHCTYLNREVKSTAPVSLKSTYWNTQSFQSDSVQLCLLRIVDQHRSVFARNKMLLRNFLLKYRRFHHYRGDLHENVDISENRSVVPDTTEEISMNFLTVRRMTMSKEMKPLADDDHFGHLCRSPMMKVTQMICLC